MAQKRSREMGNFWSTCPKASIKVISEYHNLRDLCFWSSRGFWQAWSCSKSWCIPNYQLSVSFKNSSFFVAWFSKNSRNKFLNQEFYGRLPEQAWSKCLFDFSKSCPSGHRDFQKIPKWKKVFIKMDWLLMMITNHFEIPVVQNLKTFSFFLSHWDLFSF